MFLKKALKTREKEPSSISKRSKSAAFFSTFTALLLLLSINAAPATENAGAGQPLVSASSCILIDRTTGEVLFSKNEHEKRPIASLTKIMTALVTLLEAKNLEATATASEESTNSGGSEIYLEPGEKMRLRELLSALMLRSANDAASALAENVSGRREIFIALMNRKAREIGAENTKFKNPHGLDEADHYSTAYDMALITRRALSYPVFREIVSTRETTITWLNKNRYFRSINHNKLLHRYSFIKGVKTGYTRKAGHCLVTYAEDGNRKLISVVLNAPSSAACYEDTMKLINYGFSRLKQVKIAEKGKRLKKEIAIKGKNYKLVPYADASAAVPDGRAEISYRFVPVFKQKNGFYGYLKIYLNGNLLTVITADAIRIR